MRASITPSTARRSAAPISNPRHSRRTTEALLNAAAREYVNHPRGARIESGRLVVSSIYVWFSEDFGGSDEGVIAHLKRYAEPDLLAGLAAAGRIDGFAYDWRLNDAPAP